MQTNNNKAVARELFIVQDAGIWSDGTRLVSLRTRDNTVNIVGTARRIEELLDLYYASKVAPVNNVSSPLVSPASDNKDLPTA